MRKPRLGDVAGAVSDVSDGGDLESVPFFPPAPATRLTDAAAATGAPALTGVAALPGAAAVTAIGPMPIVAAALPMAAAASVHSIESPAPNAPAAAVGP